MVDKPLHFSQRSNSTCGDVKVYFPTCQGLGGWTWSARLRAVGWGAGLVLRIFLALLPILLRLMGRVQGLYSESMLDYSVVTKYYIFQARARAAPAYPKTP